MFRYLIHFDLIFVYNVTSGQLHSFVFGHPVFQTTFVEETTFSPPCGLSTLVEDPSTIYVRVYSSTLYSVSLVYMPVFMLPIHDFVISLLITLKIMVHGVFYIFQMLTCFTYNIKVSVSPPNSSKSLKALVSCSWG